MYGTKEIKKAIDRPKLILRELVRRKSDIMNKFFQGNFGDYIMDEDWDNLIILDACRYDMFKSGNTIEGELQHFHSRGSHTGEFVQQKFKDGVFRDTVYVSSNPNPANEANAEFAAVEEVWDTGWDEDLHTVPPREMEDKTIEAEKEYPNKRLISHFLQPHYPWIGPKGSEFMANNGYTPQDRDDHIWVQLENGDLTKEQIWEVYVENLRVTLPYVQDLVDSLAGKTVITSDHGNAFGEWEIYGHPPGAYISPLVQVPWLEISHNERKKIKTTKDGERFTDEKPSKTRLRDLGYVE